MSSTDPQRPGDRPADPYRAPQTGGPDPYGTAPEEPPAGAAQDPWAAPPQSGGSAAPAGQDPRAAPPAESTEHPVPADPYGGGIPSAGAPSAGAPYSGSPYGAAPPGGAVPPPVHGAPGQIGTSRLLAGLLGILLGGLGVHRFLLGYTAIGVVQIIVTILTCGAGHLWGLIEGIMILARAEPFTRDAQGRPLTD